MDSGFIYYEMEEIGEGKVCGGEIQLVETQASSEGAVGPVGPQRRGWSLMGLSLK